MERNLKLLIVCTLIVVCSACSKEKKGDDDDDGMTTARLAAVKSQTDLVQECVKSSIELTGISWSEFTFSCENCVLPASLLKPSDFGSLWPVVSGCYTK